MEHKQLKPCKCGGKAVLKTAEIQEDDEGLYTFEMYFVECEICDEETDCEFTEADAINVWNRRAENGKS